MTIPPVLKIGGHLYTVILTIDQELLEGALGCMSEKEGKIWIDSGAPASIQESTLLHEIMHVMTTTLSEKDIGHALIDAISEQFYQVLKDNRLHF